MNTSKTKSGKTILIFDDDVDYLYSKKLELEAAGYKVETCESGQKAHEVLESVQPDLVIADLMMEQEDMGFTLCHMVKKYYPQVPVIMVTGVASETGIEFDAATEEERSWLKADAVLAKPVRFEQLAREIKKLLKE
jgi:CheY-like chemotaxis protein